MSPDMIELIKWACMAGIIYGGIRQDIKNIHEKISDVKHETVAAHARLDRHIEIYHTGEKQ